MGEHWFRAASFLWVLGCCSLIHAQQPGERVAVIEPAELKTNRTVLEVLHPGTALFVREIQGDWLAVANRRVGWVHRRHVRSLPEAIEHFSGLIERDAKDPAPYVRRGALRNESGEYVEAVSDFTAAIRLNPQLRAAYANRAIAWKHREEYEIALADYNEAIRLDPDVALTWHNRGQVWIALRRFEKAASDFGEAIRLDPNGAEGYNALAWLQATCPDAAVRDGGKAVENALAACRLSGYGRWHYVGTLAAAYAETGDFTAAVQWELRCLKMAPGEKQEEVRRRLELFQAGSPYHESIMSPVSVSRPARNGFSSSPATGSG